MYSYTITICRRIVRRSLPEFSTWEIAQYYAEEWLRKNYRTRPVCSIRVQRHRKNGGTF